MPVGRSPQAAPGELDDDITELCRTLDRSRKRNLSVGLLRGDEVEDKLKQQELSASPFFKRTKTVLQPSQLVTPTKPQAQANMALTMADFEAYMEKHTNRQLEGINDKIDSGLADVKKSVGQLEEKVGTNERGIAENQANIREIRSELRRLGSSSAAYPPLPEVRQPAHRSPAPRDLGNHVLPMNDKHEYETARRSLRLWPILGTGEELRRSVHLFLTQNLSLGTGVQMDMVEKVERVATPSGPGVRDEALVLFRDTATRDTVMGAAAKLAPFIDLQGRSTAGMRMEVPSFLRQSFKILFRYGQNLRARHGAGTRRHVKFDDAEHALYLNVKLPGDESWTRVPVEVAKRGMRAKEILNADQMEKRFDITGPQVDPRRPRAASTSSQPMQIDYREAVSRRTASTSS